LFSRVAVHRWVVGQGGRVVAPVHDREHGKCHWDSPLTGARSRPEWAAMLYPC
jgi:hypothetical protein